MAKKHAKGLDLSPPLLMVWTLRILEAVHPPSAVKIAKKYFFQPLRFKRPKRENNAYEQATKQELMLGKKKITTYSWGTEGKKILLVHGWSGRGTQFFKVKNFLLSRGFRVVAFDAPAHGVNKEEQTTHMLEFVDAIERVNMKFGPFYGAIGHSLGGLAILNAYNKGFKVDKIAVVGAPVSIGNVIRDFCRRIKAGPKTEQGLIAHLIATYEVPLEHYSGQEQVKSIKTPGLIIHDVHDEDVSIEEARGLHRVWKSSRLITTKGLGHRNTLIDKGAVADLCDFFGPRKDERTPQKRRQPSDNQRGGQRPKPAASNQTSGKEKQTKTGEPTEAGEAKPKPARRRPPRRKPKPAEGGATATKGNESPSAAPKVNQQRAEKPGAEKPEGANNISPKKVENTDGQNAPKKRPQRRRPPKKTNDQPPQNKSEDGNV